jgi:hypothetical protein
MKPCRLIINRHVPWQKIRQRSQVTRTLNVILAAQGCHTASGLANVAGEQGQINEGRNVVGTMGMLR